MDSKTVEGIARLARLRFDHDELDDITQRITAILALIGRMEEAEARGMDLGAVEPLSHPHDMTARLRADEVTEGDARAELQALAPACQDGLYLVPKVIDSSQ